MNDTDTISGIQIQLELEYPGFRLDVDMQLPGRGVSAFFGPSGCGKTTLLRILAGLEHRATGRIVIGDDLWMDSTARTFVPTHQRGIGYVFQDAQLFPHLSVSENLDYGQRRALARGRNLPVDRSSTIELLGIGGLLQRNPETLSGGERQRVAIARALLAGPRLLLLDEPLASLDLDRKREVLPYLERLHQSLQIPVLLVSHALEEIVRIADHLSLIRDGRMVASGPLLQILSRMDLPEVRTHDMGVVLEGIVTDNDEAFGLVAVSAPGVQLVVPHAPMPLHSVIRLQILPGDVSLTLEPTPLSSVLNQIPACIQSIESAHGSAHVQVLLDAGGSPLIARITRRSCERLALKPGQALWAHIKAVAVVV